MLQGAVVLAVGIGSGLLVGDDVVGWVIGAWRDYVMPAFIEINASGIPLCA